MGTNRKLREYIDSSCPKMVRLSTFVNINYDILKGEHFYLNAM